MTMRSYIYKRFSEEVLADIEKAYNKMCRYEQYLEENDIAHGLISFDDNLFPDIADPTITEQYQQELEFERIRVKGQFD